MPLARIEHVALWTRDLEGQAAFWTDVFGATLGPVYESPASARSS